MKALTTFRLNLIMTALVLFGMNTLFATNPPNSGAKLFFDGTYESAKAKAGSEGKLFLVDFYANWCTPCKWMDKTTFRNEQVVSLLNENYVSLKIDIDQTEGYNLKEKYEITMLPTILIFNSQGKMVERIEKTMTAESLGAVLMFHNHSQNKVVHKHYFNVNPKSTVNENVESEPIEEDLTKLYNDYQKSEERKTNYRVQIGYYDNYEMAFKRVNELRNEFIEPLIVLNDYEDGQTYYKLLMGEFPTFDEAESFRKILKNNFMIDGIVY